MIEVQQSLVVPAFVSKTNFCEGMFHVYPSRENHVKGHVCLRKDVTDICDHRKLILVVLINGSAFIYHRIGTDHAELVMSQDAKLQEFIVQTEKPAIMTMYIKFQPCHHSGGNSQFHLDGCYEYDDRSCTEAILQFNRAYLQPNNIALKIAIAGIYKADWEFSKRPDDIITVENSRRGLMKLIKSGIDIRSMKPMDWDILGSMVAEPIDVNILHHERRIQADAFTEAFLSKFKNKKRPRSKASFFLPEKVKQT